MANTGVNYYLGLVGVDTSRFKIYYDFNQNGAVVASVPNADASYSGIPSAVGDFWSVSGSGHFTGQYVQISNGSGISLLNGWTAILVYEREATGSMVLFSNYKSGTIGGDTAYLGFSIGVNAANRLFFEGYDDNGAYTKTFNTPLGTKSCVVIQATPNGQLTFGWYNPLTRLLETQTETIKTQFVFDSDEWYLGVNPSVPAFGESSPFLGYIDEFLFFDTPVTQSSLGELFKGFFSDGVTENDSFRQSCGMDGIVLLENPGTLNLWYVNTGQFVDEVNLSANFDFANRGFRTHTIVDTNRLTLFRNGTLQALGAYMVTGDIYHRGFALSGDYFVEGDLIRSNGVYVDEDVLVYDLLQDTGSYTYLVSGGFMTASGERFLKGTSRLFVDGKRKKLGSDFVEVSRFDLAGGGSFNQFSFLVYANEGLFWR